MPSELVRDLLLKKNICVESQDFALLDVVKVDFQRHDTRRVE